MLCCKRAGVEGGENVVTVPAGLSAAAGGKAQGAYVRTGNEERGTAGEEGARGGRACWDIASAVGGGNGARTESLELMFVSTGTVRFCRATVLATCGGP
jgi:hypothetical protein